MQHVIPYLKKLKKNNNKVWFDEHKPELEIAKKEFLEFVKVFLAELKKFDKEIADLEPEKTIFRIYRDVRFSKDKTPYKTNLGASFNRGGKKSVFAGYYFHLEPGKSFTGGGLWMPMTQELKKIRQEIDYCFKEFQDILDNRDFKMHYKVLENSTDVNLTNLPRGYEKDNPAAEFLKLKSYLATKNIFEVSSEQVNTSLTLSRICSPRISLVFPRSQTVNSEYSDSL